ncbi:MAG: hypothetical protein JW751_22060 [Polyangiaceae bacterium]|nr:hypothetical protein [Polyangiaceae bacterium]
MAAYDTDRRCLVARIVFDGAALAGKTTNLKAVRNLFPVERRSELYTPGALKGRTMFFDWLEIDGNPAGKIGVKFQLITVPGQKHRNYRRRPLVELADVIVFVVDSDPFSIVESVRTYGRLFAFLRRRDQPPPLIVQANKQDLPGALTPEQIRRRLKLSAEVPIVAAASLKGDGVRRTVSYALQLAREEILAQKQAGRVRRLAPHLASADALFMRMLDIEASSEERRPRQPPSTAEASIEGVPASVAPPAEAAAMPVGPHADVASPAPDLASPAPDGSPEATVDSTPPPPVAEQTIEAADLAAAGGDQ